MMFNINSTRLLLIQSVQQLHHFHYHLNLEGLHRIHFPNKTSLEHFIKL